MKISRDNYSFIEIGDDFMKASKIYEILQNKQKVDIFYNERPVWVQEINNDIAKVGFIDNFEEKNVRIEDLYEKNLYNA